MKFVCPTHGEVKPSKLYFSCPAQGDCPECGARLSDVDPDNGIRILSFEEGIKVRPEMYKESHPELYKKYKKGIEGKEDECE